MEPPTLPTARQALAELHDTSVKAGPEPAISGTEGVG
jgi:hypothetical protein